MRRVNIFFKKNSLTHTAFVAKRTQAWATCGNTRLETKIDQNLTKSFAKARVTTNLAC